MKAMQSLSDLLSDSCEEAVRKHSLGFATFVMSVHTCTYMYKYYCVYKYIHIYTHMYVQNPKLNEIFLGKSTYTTASKRLQNANTFEN